jgi:hypothetical protein
MQQPFNAENDVDENGNPAGGFAGGIGFSIEWQRGPLSVDGVRKEPNGAFVETILAAVKQRIEHYQDSRFACEENADAIVLIGQAIKRLDYRTRRRIEAGVEGTHKGN